MQTQRNPQLSSPFGRALQRAGTFVASGRWLLGLALVGSASVGVGYPNLPFYDDFSYTNGTPVDGVNGWEIYSNGPGYGSLGDEYHGWQGFPGGTATASGGEGHLTGISLLRSFGDYTGEPGTGWPNTTGEYDKAPLVTVRYAYEPDVGYTPTTTPTVWSKYGNMFSNKRWHYENRNGFHKMMTVVRYFVKNDGRISAYDGHRIQHLNHAPITTRTLLTVTADYENRTWSLWLDDTQVVNNYALFKTHKNTDMQHDGWYKDYDGLKEFGFIDASSNSVTRIDTVRIFEGTVADRSLPFIENFETRTVSGQAITMSPGDLNGQNQWFSTGSAVATAAQNTNPSSTGIKGVEITGGDECFQLFLDGRTDVWSDFWMKPLHAGSGDVNVDAGGGDAVFRIDATGSLHAYDGASSTVVGTIDPAQWIRFTAHTDYATQTWSLFVNGLPVATDLAFQHAEVGDGYQEFRVSASGTAIAQLDDISLSLTTPFLNPQVSFQTTTAAVGEDTTLVTVTALLDRSHGSQVKVDYVLQPGGTATATDDFTFTSGTLTFAPGETSKSFSFTVVNDTDNEEDESLIFRLLNPVNATLGTIAQITYTIQSDPADWKNLPFVEPFEARTTGDLDGQHGWTASLMEVQTAIKYQDAKAARSTRTGAEMAHTFTNGVKRVVTQWRAIPVFAQHAPVPPAGSTYALYVDTSGHIIAYDGATPLDMGATVTLTAGQWAHFAVSTDHNTKTWDLEVNGVSLGAGFNFYANQSDAYREFGVVGPVTVDDISIGYDTASPPDSLAAEAYDATVILSWNAAQGADSYIIKRAASPGGPYTTLGSTANTGYSDTSAANDVTYYYVVTAMNPRGESAPSNEIAATPRAAVTGVVTESGISFVNLSWDAFPGATGYVVRRSTVPGGPYTILASPSDASYQDTAVVNGAVYYYAITAQTPEYLSTESAVVTGTPSLRTIFYDSFETPNVSGRFETDIPGWTRTLLTGSSNSRAGLWDENSLSMITPFGDQAAWVWSDRMITTTDILEPLQEDVTYTLTFNAAAEYRQGGITYKAELMAGNTVLDSVQAAWPVNTMDFIHRSERIDFTVPPGHPAIGQPLGIRLRYESGDWHYVLGYDNVRLAANVEAPPVEPDPMTFASPPAATDSISAEMTASPTTSGVAPITYRFENVNNGSSSGWVTDPTWTQTPLTPGVAYSYRVKARDVYGIESGWSAVSTTTPLDTVGQPSVGLGAGPSSFLSDSATLRGELFSGGVALAIMCWGTTDAGTQNPNAWLNQTVVGAISSGQNFSTPISGLSESTTYFYRVYVVNAAGTAWTDAASFTTTGPANVITGTAGNRDSWNVASNWTYDHAPTGTEAAVVLAGLTAQVNNADTPSYSGGLTLGENSTLQVGWSVATGNSNALGTGSIVMNSGSVIIARTDLGNYTFTQPFVLSGNATIWGAISTANSNTTKTFAAGVSGPGKLTFNGANNCWFVFNTDNAAWTGGFQSSDPENERHQVRAAANGAFGTGDVAINNNCSLHIQGGLSDTIHDGAALVLAGASSTTLASKLVLDSNETVHQLWVDGVQQPAGTYTNTQSWLSGSGVLTVIRGPAVPTLILFR